jgi:DNA-binding phage protein
MLTRESLADLLRDVRVIDVAREAAVCTKTIYRLRHQAHAPTLTTLERVLKAVERVKERKAAPDAA